MTYHAAYQPQRAIRTERWKYIRRFDDYPHPVLANCDDAPSKDLLVEHGWAEQPVRPPRSSTTWSSTRTRAATWPASRRTRPWSSELRGRLEAWMVERGDPLLRRARAAAAGGARSTTGTRSPRPSRPHRVPLRADPTAAPSR